MEDQIAKLEIDVSSTLKREGFDAASAAIKEIKAQAGGAADATETMAEGNRNATENIKRMTRVASVLNSALAGGTSVANGLGLAMRTLGSVLGRAAPWIGLASIALNLVSILRSLGERMMGVKKNAEEAQAQVGKLEQGMSSLGRVRLDNLKESLADVDRKLDAAATKLLGIEQRSGRINRADTDLTKARLDASGRPQSEVIWEKALADAREAVASANTREGVLDELLPQTRQKLEAKRAQLSETESRRRRMEGVWQARKREAVEAGLITPEQADAGALNQADAGLEEKITGARAQAQKARTSARSAVQAADYGQITAFEAQAKETLATAAEQRVKTLEGGRAMLAKLRAARVSKANADQEAKELLKTLEQDADKLYEEVKGYEAEVIELGIKRKTIGAQLRGAQLAARKARAAESSAEREALYKAVESGDPGAIRKLDETIRGSVAPGNTRMGQLFDNAGLPISTRMQEQVGLQTQAAAQRAIRSAEQAIIGGADDADIIPKLIATLERLGAVMTGEFADKQKLAAAMDRLDGKVEQISSQVRAGR